MRACLATFSAVWTIEFFAYGSWPKLSHTQFSVSPIPPTASGFG